MCVEDSWGGYGCMGWDTAGCTGMVWYVDRDKDGFRGCVSVGGVRGWVYGDFGVGLNRVGHREPCGCGVRQVGWRCTDVLAPWVHIPAEGHSGWVCVW